MFIKSSLLSGLLKKKKKIEAIAAVQLRDDGRLGAEKMERSIEIPDLFGKQNRSFLMLEGDGRNVERAIKDDFLGFWFMQFARWQIYEIKKNFFFKFYQFIASNPSPSTLMHACSVM